MSGFKKFKIKPRTSKEFRHHQEKVQTKKLREIFLNEIKDLLKKNKNESMIIKNY